MEKGEKQESFLRHQLFKCGVINRRCSMFRPTHAQNDRKPKNLRNQAETKHEWGGGRGGREKT